MPQITAPHPFSGSTMFGPVAVTFAEGVAQVDDLPGPVANYMRACGYEIADDKPKRRKAAEA